MKKFTLFFILFSLLLTLGLNAQEQIIKFDNSWGDAGYSIVNQKTTGLEIIYSVDQFVISETEVKGEKLQNISLSGVYLFNEAGMPDLPGNGKMIAVPEGAEAILKVVDYKIERYQNINLAPAPIIPFDTETEMIYEKNEKVFSEDRFYPENPFQLSSITEMRGVDAVMFGVTPFQYNPVTKELIVYRDVKFDIEFKGGKGQFGDKRLRSRWWDPILADALLNYSSLPKIDYSQRNNNSKDTEFEYVILTLDDPVFVQWADSIAEFRRKQGISTGIYTIADVPGGNTVSSIEAWVDNLYNSWTVPPSAILIMADYGTGTEGITSQSYPHPYSGTYISDNHYADVTNNDLPDIVFARMTAQNESHLQIMISKFLDYERTPPTSEYFYNHPISALGWQDDRWFQICSEVVGGFWNNQGKSTVRINAPGYPANNHTNGPWSTATNTSTVINYFGENGLGYIPDNPGVLGGFTGGVASDVNNAINAGSFMLQHRDHGYESGWGEPDYDSGDIDGLTNTDLPYVWSINCLTGNFDLGYEVFAEKFHRYTYGGENSGAVGVMAASQVSYSFVNDVFVWGAYDNMWPEFMPDYGTEFSSNFILPAFASAAGKHFLFQSSWPYNTDSKQITYRLFHHHGDAFLNVYSEVPQDMTVTSADVHVFGNPQYDITIDAGAFISLTYYDAVNEETVIITTSESTGGVTSLDMTSCPPVGTNMLLTITKQNYFRYTENVLVISPSGPYLIANALEINDGGNNEAEFGETFNLDITVKNVGSDPSTGITASLTTTDSYVQSLTNAVGISYSDLAADASETSSGQFTVQLTNDVPDQHTIIFDMEISDNSTKSVYNSGLSFKVNAPNLSVGELIIDDSSTGNNDGILDPGETADILIETSNIGNADITNVITAISTTSTDLVLNSYTTTPSTLNIGESANFVFNVTANSGVPLGTPADLVYNVTAGENDQYSTDETKEVIIGLIPEFNINNGGSVTTCVGLFYDSGGESGSYQNNENNTMTFYPGTSNSVIEANFTSFNVESHSSCNYDALKIYDGTGTSATLIGTYCGSNSPGLVTATNDDGALTFVFTSDGSVTEFGWVAEISCFITGTPSGVLSATTSEICAGNSTGTMTLSNNTEPITSWEKSQDGGSWETIDVTTNTYSETIATECTMEYRAVLDGGAYYSNIVSITALESPISNYTYVANNQEVSFTNTSSNATSYFWDFGYGFSSTLENPVFTFLTSGSFNVVLTASNEECESENSQTIDIIFVNVSDIGFEDIEIYPNPGNGIFYISLKDSEGVDVQITDINGKVIYKNIISGVLSQIDLSKHSKGVYFIQLNINNELVTGKIMLK